MKLSKLFWWILKGIGALVAFVILYFISAAVLSNIVVNADVEQPGEKTYEVYVLTNGVHTDIVLPYKNDLRDWSQFVSVKDTRSKDTTSQFVAFGWGDKGFYLQTKTWDDLKFSTAFNALFYLSSSAMHVTFYNKMRESEACKKIVVSEEAYKKLCDYISESFDADSVRKPIRIENAYYYRNDSFYEAKGSYSLFFTCNTWTNDALKTAGLKACLWTPYDKSILDLY